MTVQYLRALHSAGFPRGRNEDELLAEFALRILRVHEDIKYARILDFLQSKSCVVTEPVFGSVGSMPEASDQLGQLLSCPEHQSHSPSDSVYQQSPPGHFSWHSSARSPAITYQTVPLSAHTQQHGGYLSPVQGLDHH